MRRTNSTEAPAREVGGHVGRGNEQPRSKGQLGLPLLGCGAMQGGVAVVRVVEGLEDAGLLAQVIDATEALGAEEAFVEHVVEVFDDGVPPCLRLREARRTE